MSIELQGQGKELPSSFAYRGQWILESRIFLFVPDEVQSGDPTAPQFTPFINYKLWARRLDCWLRCEATRSRYRDHDRRAFGGQSCTTANARTGRDRHDRRRSNCEEIYILCRRQRRVANYRKPNTLWVGVTRMRIDGSPKVDHIGVHFHPPRVVKTAETLASGFRSVGLQPTIYNHRDTPDSLNPRGEIPFSPGDMAVAARFTRRSTANPACTSPDCRIPLK